MGAFVDAGVVLVRLAADEAVEVFEAAAGAGPVVERPHRAGLPHRHLVALAELGRRVAVQLQRLGQRRAGVGPHRGVARRRGGQFRDAAHARAVVVAAGHQRLPGGRAQGRGVEAVVLEPLGRQALGRRHVHGSAEGRRGAKAAVVDEDDEHVGRARGRSAAARSAHTSYPRPWRRTSSARRVECRGSEGSRVGFCLGLSWFLLLCNQSFPRTAASVGKLRPSPTKPAVRPYDGSHARIGRNLASDFGFGFEIGSAMTAIGRLHLNPVTGGFATREAASLQPQRGGPLAGREARSGRSRSARQR